MKFTIIQNKKESQRLAFVKGLKELTGLGLKEAKDLADDLNYNFDRMGTSKKTIELGGADVLKKIRDFQIYVKENCSGMYNSLGTEHAREMKMLMLGIGEKEHYVDFISDTINACDDSNELIKEILNELPKEKLNDILIKINNRLNIN